MFTDKLLDVANGLSDRKKRLFICACARRSWGLLGGRGREAVRRGELMADGGAYCERTMEGARAEMNYRVLGSGNACAQNDALLACVRQVKISTIILTPEPLTGEEHASVLADLAGPALPPPPVTAQALSLAQAAYDERSVRKCEKCLAKGCWAVPHEGSPTCPDCRGDGRIDDGALDPVRLAVLADALEEAGCQNGLLYHLRSPGPHYRGCWAVDAVLGKR